MAGMPQCPKCRSRKFMAIVHELCEAGAPVVDGEVTENWSASALAQRQACFGECGCGHRWRFRDAWAIQ